MSDANPSLKLPRIKKSYFNLLRKLIRFEFNLICLDLSSKLEKLQDYKIFNRKKLYKVIYKLF